MSSDRLHLGDLGRMVKERRSEERLSLRDAAEQIEVSFNTLARVERGHVPDLGNFRRIVAWLGLPPERFFEPARKRWESTPETIAKHLHEDPDLSAEAATQIESLVRSMYSALLRREPTALHLRAAKTFDPEAAALLAQLVDQMQDKLFGGEVDR